jgi:hypothetical protein
MNETTVKRELRARAAPTFTGAWLWAFWGGLAATAAAAAVVLFISTQEPLWLAAGFGAVIFWHVLGERKQVHDDQLYIETIEEPPTPPAPPAAHPGMIQPWIVRPTPGGQHIQHGTISLTLKQWQTLARLFLQHGKLARRVVAESAVFENITQRYPEVQKEFSRLGLFDGNGLLTETGRNFWKAFLTPPPSPSWHNGAVASVQPTTTDDDRGVTL